MKPSLQLKLSQHLALTPQLQQSIKLLQQSTLELNQEIEKVLLENPMIERDEPEAELGSSRIEAPGPVAQAGSEAAHERDMVVIGLSGRGGGKMNQALRDTDVHISVPHDRTARVQEVHLLTLHCLCDAVDALLLGDQETSL